MKKYTINMKSIATSVKGQGVGSAYMEQVKLVKEGLSDKFEIFENARMQADITHYHTFNPDFYLSRKHDTKKGVSVCYVHTLPETMDKSIDIPKWSRKIFYKYIMRELDEKTCRRGDRSLSIGIPFVLCIYYSLTVIT